MRSLTEITRDLFTRYSERKTGRKANWHKLSSDRKGDWLEDSYMLIEELLVELEKEFNLKLPDKSPQTSYESGIMEGMRREQVKIRGRLDDIKQKYLAELEKFIKQCE